MAKVMQKQLEYFYKMQQNSLIFSQPTLGLATRADSRTVCGKLDGPLPFCIVFIYLGWCLKCQILPFSKNHSAAVGVYCVNTMFVVVRNTAVFKIDNNRLR